MEPILSGAHERLGDTGDESRESVCGGGLQRESFTYFYETYVMEHFYFMLHKDSLLE